MYIFARKMESLGKSLSNASKIEVSHCVVFWLLAFAHKKMKAGRGVYDCDDVSVTKARPTRSKN